MATTPILAPSRDPFGAMADVVAEHRRVTSARIARNAASAARVEAQLEVGRRNAAQRDAAEASPYLSATVHAPRAASPARPTAAAPKQAPVMSDDDRLYAEAFGYEDLHALQRMEGRAESPVPARAETEDDVLYREMFGSDA